MTAERQPVRPSGLTPAHALTAAVVLLAAGVLASLYQDRLFRTQRIHELTVQGEIVAASVTAALVFGDVKAVQEHVTALAINPEIAAAAVYGTTGDLVAAFARRDAEPLPRSARDPSLTLPDPKIVIHIPVTQKGERLGTVFIRATDEPLSRRLTRHAAMMLLAIMAALLVAFMGTTQRTLREVNRQLESRAVALSETNRLLQSEMEERSKAEDALRQSQKMEAVGRLAGGIAHDFNNLLTIIQGNLHLLRTTDADDRKTMQAYVAGADVAAERAGQLVRRLLAFSRRQPLTPRPVDLNELVNGMKDLIIHSVGEAVRVEFRLRADRKTVCDVNQMENVVLNLAINARDAMTEGGMLTIETDDISVDADHRASDVAPGDYVQLKISDTGVGMSEDVRKHAVDPFFTTKSHGHGTGLGLSTAFAFIRQSNGSLNIDSEPGKGTCISILLPRYLA